MTALRARAADDRRTRWRARRIVCSWRCRAAPTRSRSLHLLLELQAAATDASRARALQSSVARRRRGRGRGVLPRAGGRPRSPDRVGSRGRAARSRAERRTFDRRCRHGPRYAFLEHAADRLAPTRSPPATRSTIRRRRFCCGCSAGPARAGWRAIRPRAGRVVRPLIEIGRADLRRVRARRGDWFREGCDQRRPVDSAKPSPARADPLSRERVFTRRLLMCSAREAAMAREMTIV